MNDAVSISTLQSCALALLAACALSGCSELRARHNARTGNEQFRAGEFAEAVRSYEAAERLAPDLWVAVFNKGLACRQLILPGSKSPVSARATECALQAFERLRNERPQDPRGEQLYVQTLFDAERFRELTELYQKRLAQQPNDPLALNGMIQVYTRWNRPADVLHWLKLRADRMPKDAEAQYAVGVYAFSQLLERGGGPDKGSFDPRAGAEPPMFSVGDLIGSKRVELANSGIAYLERALAIRPSYREALVYLNLLYRQKSFAYFDRPEDWQAAVQSAESYRNKAVALDASHRAAR